MPGILIIIVILFCLLIGTLYLDTKRQESPPSERPLLQTEKITGEKKPLRKKKKIISRRYEYLPELPVSQIPPPSPPTEPYREPVDLPPARRAQTPRRREIDENEGAMVYIPKTMPIDLSQVIIPPIQIPPIFLEDKAIQCDLFPLMESRDAQTDFPIQIPSFLLQPLRLTLAEEGGEEASIPNLRIRRESGDVLPETEERIQHPSGLNLDQIPTVGSIVLGEERESISGRFSGHNRTIDSEIILVLPDGTVHEESGEPFFSVIVQNRRFSQQELSVIPEQVESPQRFRLSQSQLRRSIGDMSFEIMERSLQSFHPLSRVGSRRGSDEDYSMVMPNLLPSRPRTLNSLTLDEFEIVDR